MRYPEMHTDAYCLYFRCANESCAHHGGITAEGSGAGGDAVQIMLVSTNADVFPGCKVLDVE